ncbi:DUF5320 domain-containing protein [Candidatus Parcubacteria bacterium]|nr:DUF5320 domain-containing protein [Candidatus Parcubacteria bacterium]
MPYRNGTGPEGKGPKTGRGLGPCGDGTPRGNGRGLGLGRGRGKPIGRGLGRNTDNNSEIKK